MNADQKFVILFLYFFSLYYFYSSFHFGFYLQLHRIRNLLTDELKDVEVGTAETFQGREKRIIIVSCVRAQDSLLLYDRKYNLGFVKNEKVTLYHIFYV